MFIRDITEKIITDDPLPYYAQLKRLLLKRIESGEWKPHSKLPSELELCQTYGVSRTVVRQALSTLLQEGIINRQKGRGSFVTEPKVTEGLFQNLIGFHEEMAARGMQPVTKVLEQTIINADDYLANKLGTNLGEKVMKIDRLRFIEENPLVFSTTYIPHSCCPGLVDIDLTRRSLYETLEVEFSLSISHGTRTIEVNEATAKEAKLLKIQPGKALLSVESRSFLVDGTVFEYSIAKHRADRSRFEINLLRTNKNIKSLIKDFDNNQKGANQ